LPATARESPEGGGAPLLLPPDPLDVPLLLEALLLLEAPVEALPPLPPDVLLLDVLLLDVLLLDVLLLVEPWWDEPLLDELLDEG
jgi:hypothetical protein